MITGAGRKITEFSLDRPKVITWVMVASTMLIGILVGVPSMWPQTFPALNAAAIDTDPENMLPPPPPANRCACFTT